MEYIDRKLEALVDESYLGSNRSLSTYARVCVVGPYLVINLFLTVYVPAGSNRFKACAEKNSELR